MDTPHKHHFVPKFHLKGFTNADGKLWVTDFKTRRQWTSTPLNSAFERDFYKADLGEDINPMWFETAMGENVEPIMAQVLEFILDTKEIPPCGHAYDIFLNLIAFSCVRG